MDTVDNYVFSPEKLTNVELAEFSIAENLNLVNIYSYTTQLKSTE